METNTTPEIKYEVWVGGNLFEDWDTRGILLAMESDNDALEIVSQNKKRTLIRATMAQLDGLVYDAELQIQDCHEPAPSWKRTVNRFIARVNAVKIKSEFNLDKYINGILNNQKETK